MNNTNQESNISTTSLTQHGTFNPPIHEQNHIVNDKDTPGIECQNTSHPQITSSTTYSIPIQEMDIDQISSYKPPELIFNMDFDSQSTPEQFQAFLTEFKTYIGNVHKAKNYNELITPTKILYLITNLCLLSFFNTI